MMDYFIITGTSSGLGKSLAEKAIQRNAKVIGISRNASSITHASYQHIALDLSDSNALLHSFSVIFPDIYEADRVVLINNAGTLGDAGYLGELSSENISRTIQVNITAVALLMNEFIRKYEKLSADKIVMNISSGAGKRAVDGWALYCASKAAMDMMTLTAADEEKNRKRNFKFYSIAPGRVDTPMQAQIRKTPENLFSGVKEFIRNYEEGELISPEMAAEKLLKVIETGVDKVILSVKDL